MTTDPQNILTEVLAKMDIPIEDISLTQTEPHVMFMVRTPEAKKLIGVRGENLRALNIVVKRIVEHKLGSEHLNFTIDVGGYQQERIDEIKRRVQILAERVRAFKVPTELSPMNAYERMIVHSLLAADPELYTESIGDGRLKKVVIHYKEQTGGMGEAESSTTPHTPAI